MLSVCFELFNLGIDHLLPGDVLRVGHEELLLDDRDIVQKGRSEVTRSETLGLDIDGHVSHLLVSWLCIHLWLGGAAGTSVPVVRVDWHWLGLDVLHVRRRRLHLGLLVSPADVPLWITL